MPTQASRAPLLSPGDRAVLDKTGWLSDMHMEAANVLLREAFPAVDGLQNPILHVKEQRKGSMGKDQTPGGHENIMIVRPAEPKERSQPMN